VTTSNLAAFDFGQGLSNAWSSVAAFVPKLVAFLVIMVIGWLVAKAIAKIVNKVLEKVGFDRVVERGGIKQALSRSKYDASDLISKLVYYAILLIALQIAFGVWGPNPVSVLLAAIVAWLPRAAVAIIIVVIAGAIAKAVHDMVDGALSGLSYGKVLATVASIFIWGLGIVAALNQIGVATAVTTPVLFAVLGTVGGILVVGLGGGMVRPMQQRWENWLGRAESELPSARAHAEAYRRGREDALRGTGQPTERVEQPTGATTQSGGAAEGHQSGTVPPGQRGPGQTPPTSGSG
jgi:Conserved TM helix